MIVFEEIKWKNFLSTGNSFTEIQIDDSPSHLILGSNGAGKSTMLDALCFVLFNKPFNVLSQFTDKEKQFNTRENLSDYINIPNIYPAGRLDKDSEGLLILTDEGLLQSKISDPKYKVAKTYWVQIEGKISKANLEKLRQGVHLKDGITLKAQARRIIPQGLWPRTPPIRERKKIPVEWLEIIIMEGRNRQVRRMTASVGHPTLRLIRVQIGSWKLDNLESGCIAII